MTQLEVIRTLVPHIKAGDELSEALLKSVIALTMVDLDPKEESEKAVEVEAASEPPKPKKPGPKPGTKPKGQKPIDDGRIKALWEGGWSVSKIADDMQLSGMTVRAHLKKMGFNTQKGPAK